MILVVQGFLDNLGKTLSTLVRLIFMSRFGTSVPRVECKGECVILGNGPSLNKSVAEAGSFLFNKTLIAVNLMPSTPMYTELSPSWLVLTAPEFWRENVARAYIDQREKLFNDLAEKTQWKLHLFIPAEARSFLAWQQKISVNPNITIHYFNVTPVEGFRWFRHVLFSMRSGMPRPHNVLSPSLMIAIWSGYKKIYLLGADHSWLPEITVDDNNDVLVNQKHYYDSNTSTPQTMSKLGRGKRKLHEVLHKFYLAFASYFVIREYSEKREAKILNATPGSFIDAFDRCKINE